MTSSTSTALPTSDLATYLRESTAAAHKDAESRPLNRALARGTIPREAWIANLEQLFLLHRALDARVARSLGRHPEWQAIADRARVADLEADLAAFGSTGAPTPVAAIASGVAEIEAASDDEIAGMLYVTEGSTNGGRFLVKSLTRALGANGATPTRALDPYGDQQPARWAQFKAVLAALPFDPVRFDLVRRGADRMFAMIGEIAEQVWSRAQPAA